MDLHQPTTTGFVCVTGASGFLASWLVKSLLNRGYRVRGTVRDPSNKAKTAHLWALPGAQERLELVAADLLVEGSFDAAVHGCDGVFHTATVVQTVKADPQSEMIDPAVNGTLNVLTACSKATSVQRIVLTSSSSAVRFKENINPDIPLNESDWTSIDLCQRYQLWYALAKTLAEKRAMEFAEKNKLDVVVLLPAFVIGPTLPPDLCSTASDVLGLLKGVSSRFALHGRMGYVHIDDVSTAHILLYEKQSAHGCYLCCATVLENYDLAKFLSDRYPNLNIPKKFESLYSDRPRYQLDTSKLNNLGLTHYKSLEEMFDDCIASFKKKALL